ncbi:hypothetical protein [Streptomyces sp. NRRL S-1022]|nr:hypothetical protein [Streptomyces sp. NRRL S-1022]
MRFMQHLALWEAPALGGERPETTWLEHVADEQYRAKRTSSH